MSSAEPSSHPWRSGAALCNRAPSPGLVVVTGASSGIGRALAEALARLGHGVLATARAEADLAALEALDGVTAVGLDVRSADDAAALARAVAADGRPLHGLVNNAGVGDLGPMDSFDDADLARLFDVNVFGVHRVTRALTRALVGARGRVVHVGSQGGSLSKACFGAYCMTKHALEAHVDALAEELAPHGVHVAVVQPGGIATEIDAKSLPRNRARLERAEAPFDVVAAELLEALGASAPPDDERPESEENRKPSSPDVVVEAVCHALYADAPWRRYLVGTRWEGLRVVRALLARLASANAAPSLGLTRDELVACLDDALDAHPPRTPETPA